MPNIAAMTLRASTAILIGMLLTTSSAQALSITNRDDRDHKVTVMEGASQKDHALKAKSVLPNVCDQGCMIRLDDNMVDIYELEGSEATSIEEGQLYDDEFEVPAGQSLSPAGQPSQPVLR